MNRQPAAYAAQYQQPSYPAQAELPYPYPYPPPPQLQGQSQHASPYQYHNQQQQSQYFRTYPNTLAPAPQAPAQPQAQPQQPAQKAKQAPRPRKTQKSSRAGPVAAPQNDPGAPAPAPSSPEDEGNADTTLNGEPSQYGPNGEDEDGPIFNMPPPPEANYANEEEMEKAIHEWSKDHGYELVRRATKRNAKREVYKRYIHCSKYGNESRRVAEPRRRVNRKNNRLGCPMSICVVAVDPGDGNGEWQVRHRKTHHNHPAMEAVQLAGHRRRARMGAVEKAVDGLFELGTDTSRVVKFLQTTHPDGLFTRTDVANMKNKWKKWGTCADRLQSDRRGTAPTGGYKTTHTGFADACQACRNKRMGCTNEKPVCRNCEADGSGCHYDDDVVEVEDDEHNDLFGEGPSAQLNGEQPQAAQQNGGQQGRFSKAQLGRMSAQKKQQTEEILSNLQSFTQTHFKPNRLTLQDSSVEVLAQSSCGDGNSYDRLPFFNHERDWPAFRDSMVEASLKEGTHGVLTGATGEPQRPHNNKWKEGEVAEIEAWNEYIKQLAIYKRRSDMLLYAFFKKLGPGFRGRIQALQKPNEVWQLLESNCLPRGSDMGYRLYCDLHSITLDNSDGLSDYINRLEAMYSQIKSMKINTTPNAPSGIRPASTSKAKTGEDAVPEEMMVFLFLRGLGQQWIRWVEGLCATNNIGGFGTGERLGFKEVSKRAQGHEAMQRRDVGR